MLKLLRQKRDECEDKVVELVKGAASMANSQESAHNPSSPSVNMAMDPFRQTLEARMQNGLGNAKGSCTQVVNVGTTPRR